MIDVISVVVTPFYTYLKYDSYIVHVAQFPKENITYYHNHYYLIKDSEETRRLFEEIYAKRGVTIRYSYENWPNLENELWRTTNNIHKY